MVIIQLAIAIDRCSYRMLGCEHFVAIVTEPAWNNDIIVLMIIVRVLWLEN